MKKQKLKIVVGINSLTESQWPAYNNHLQLFYRLGKDNPNMDLVLCNPSRVGIDKMRNSAAAVVKNNKFDYLLFIDDDVTVPSDTLQRLLACDADIAAGDVCIRSYPFDFMCFKYTSKDKDGMKALAKYPKGKDIIDVDAVGFSCCLIKRQIIEKVPEPYFITGLNNTEDVYFCIKARQVSPDCKIVVDTQLHCGHILWPELIGSYNKKAYSEYYRKINPGVMLPTETTLKLVHVDPSVNYEDIVRESMS